MPEQRFEFLDSKARPPLWFPWEGQAPRIIISSVALFRRNIDGILFPPFKGDESQAEKACRTIEDALDNHPELELPPRIDPSVLTPKSWLGYIRDFAASPEFLSAPAARCARIFQKGPLTCRINSMDHLVLHATLPNLRLDDGLKQIRGVLAPLETELTFARDPHLGYVTAKPEFCGAGFSAHVNLNLPGIILTGYVQQAVNAAAELGFRFKFEMDKREDKTAFHSNIALLTAVCPPNSSPEETVARLTDFVLKLEQHELDARGQLVTRAVKPRVLDLVGRARAIIDGANFMSPDEAVSTLSSIWLGNELGIRTNKLKQRDFFCCYTDMLFQSFITKISMFGEQTPERNAKLRARHLKLLFNPKPPQPKAPETQQDID